MKFCPDNDTYAVAGRGEEESVGLGIGKPILTVQPETAPKTNKKRIISVTTTFLPVLLYTLQFFVSHFC
jgi:hypothetical protein